MVHGTATGWRWHRCRCRACHRALLAEGKVTWALRRVRAGADPGTRIPAHHARRHLRQLQAAGMTRAEVAQRAGVSAATISRLAEPDTLRVSRITAAAVLAVEP
jgi:hypothetical protein